MSGFQLLTSWNLRKIGSDNQWREPARFFCERFSYSKLDSTFSESLISDHVSFNIVEKLKPCELQRHYPPSSSLHM